MRRSALMAALDWALFLLLSASLIGAVLATGVRTWTT